MVKTLISILIALGLLIGISIFQMIHIEREFADFSAQLEALYDKTEAQTATREDAEAVRVSWNEKKKTMHIWVPHTDISYVDYWLSEGLSLIDTKQYDQALSKIEVLIDICRKIPSSYSFSVENVL
ncbi:MAG: DUF4363 family protein [Clostridia bacterium]|nr:DUF4363 family protein [Clostridia bacterium]